ncbi:MAG TPA: tetratricopeptide repeat protein, partial [Pyrinomonadaceae bacterium]|nr:tetratricopeptide repeat protein [Pyrinomonadaceae bacterium]
MSKVFATVVMLILAGSAQAQTLRSIEDYEKRGAQRYTQSDYDGAISDFTMVIEMVSGLGSKEDLRGNDWSPPNGPNNLTSKRVTVIDPRAAVAYSNRGIAKMAKGDSAGAISDFDVALSINPGQALVYYNRGTVWLSVGDSERAFADYDKSVRLDSRLAISYVGRATARLNKGDRAGALIDYEQAIKLAPRNAQIYYNRG